MLSEFRSKLKEKHFFFYLKEIKETIMEIMKNNIGILEIISQGSQILIIQFMAKHQKPILFAKIDMMVSCLLLSFNFNKKKILRRSFFFALGIC